MNDEMSNVVEKAADVAEAAKDAVAKIDPEVIVKVKNNPMLLAGTFVGGVITTIAGTKAFKAIKDYKKYLDEKKAQEKEEKTDNEASEDKQEQAKNDSNGKDQKK